MKKANSLNEQIDRILQVSEYKIPETKRSLVEMMSPLGEIAPSPVQTQGAQAQPAVAQQQPPQNDAAFEHEIDTALSQIVQTLPQELQKVATTQGDRDGQLEPVGQTAQQPLAGQQTVQATQQSQTSQPAVPTQQVAETELDEALLATIAGGALAAPAIAGLIGKTASFLGKKLDNQTIQAFGEKVSHMAEHLHHKYIGTIEKLISPLTQRADPQTRTKIANGIFYALVATLGGAGALGASHAAHSGNLGLAAIEGGLTGVKASELISAVRGIIPKI